MSNTHGTWPYTVKPGDVLETASGDLRVVRKCVTGASGYTTWVHLVIRRCSWTKRCYTVLNYHDLKGRGFRPTGLLVKLDTKTDRKIARDLKYDNRFKQKVSCCDVVTVP